MTRFRVNVGAFGTPLPRLQPRYRVAGATAVAAAAGYGVHRHLETRDAQFRISRLTLEAFCGAVGEVAQVCVLYPLETIKVRCQADSVGMRMVLKQLLEAKPGLKAVRALYAGFAMSAVCSVVVGAIHYVTFCGSKRLALSLTANSNSSATASSVTTTSTATGAAVHADHHTAAATHAGVAGTKEGGEDRTFANMFSAVSSAVLTALIEAPTELFRHQAQAGICSGNFLVAMADAVRKGGPGALYWGFLPYCFESFPYDITELATYGHLRDAYTDASNKPSPYATILAAVPETCWDLVIGATAGAAATLLSMPFDCVKTYMQTHGAAVGAAAAHGAHGMVAGNGLWGQTAAFFHTGMVMVQRNGLSALFVGTVPRLIQQVPSCTVCWWVIEQCRRQLEPFVVPLDGDAQPASA